MDWLIWWSILAAYLVCVGFSAVYLRRFAKTRDKRSLWKGLALLLGLPGLLALWVTGWVLLHSEDYDPGGVMCYMPASLGHSEQAGPETEEDRMQRAELQEKYRGRVSTKTFQKLSGSVFTETPSNVKKTVSGGD